MAGWARTPNLGVALLALLWVGAPCSAQFLPEKVPSPVPGHATLGPPVPVASATPSERTEVDGLVQEYLQSHGGPKKQDKELPLKKTEKVYEVGQQVDFRVFWKNGPWMETVDKAFRVHVGGLIHGDAGWWRADEQVMFAPGGVGPLNDGAILRRGRIHLRGTMYETFDWMLEVGFENRLPQFFNAYGELTQLPWIGSVRFGHFREPFGMEALTGYNDLTFIERAMLLDPFVPFFNMGTMATGWLVDDRATYAAGIFRTSSDNFNAADFSDGAYSYTGRLTAVPLYQEGVLALHLGAALSYRVFPYLNAQGQPAMSGGLRRNIYQVRPEDRVNAPFFISTGVLQADHDQRLGAEFGLSLGPFLIQVEYMAAMGEEAAPPGRDYYFQGFYVAASWFLTGEHRGYLRKEGYFAPVRPNENFFFVRGGEDTRLLLGLGAWELAARYSQVDLDSGGIQGGSLRALTLGLNWYFNPNCRALFNYILTWRDGATPQSNGLVTTLGTRFQIEF